MDGKNKVSVEILGETYTIKGDAEPERILQVAAWLNERMKKISQANSRLSTPQVAVLAALNIADEYLRLEQDYQQLMKMVRDQKKNL
ncbi:cell division protein ZapA [Acetonema longum]|uniref:Cell division protein ZapA n=1 Tax=Acetonema longum DSM 6540 TaxID=1009370 RepID=F7NNF3_9FIRM|nr:cell division protein ZapA [Acetonema longum]EGO62394.1 Z ring-associated protein [Acetonema longum DSM 6540]